MKNFSKSQIFIVATLVIGVPLALILLFFLVPESSNTSSQARQVSMAVPLKNDWQMIDHDGNSVTADNYQDKYLLIFFGFTFCPDVCPFELQTISKTLRLLDQDTLRKLQPLFVSVDHQRDTPEILKEYVAMFHPDIIGLTGTPDEISKMAKDFKVYYQKTDDSENFLINHSAYTYLVSPHGHMIDIFSSNHDPSKMAAIIRSMLK